MKKLIVQEGVNQDHMIRGDRQNNNKYFEGEGSEKFLGTMK